MTTKIDIKRTRRIRSVELSVALLWFLYSLGQVGPKEAAWWNVLWLIIGTIWMIIAALALLFPRAYESVFRDD